MQGMAWAGMPCVIANTDGNGGDQQCQFAETVPNTSNSNGEWRKRNAMNTQLQEENM